MKGCVLVSELINELMIVVEQIKSQGRMSFHAGATEELIETFEKKHNIKLPSKLIAWLLFTDGCECFLPAGVQLYGVAHSPLIDVNDDDRPNDRYVVIGRLASGDPILCEREGEQISIYNHEAGRIERDEIYSDLFAFLRDLYELLGVGD